ncbi:Clavaminate synthase-like protein, partial [Periconia macrospinosa]
ASNHDHLATINEQLTSSGLAIRRLSFKDDSSEYMTEVVVNLGRLFQHGPPTAHNSSQGWLWDVRPEFRNNRAHGTEPMSDARANVQNRDLKPARSETMQQFPWHTDCSWDPPRYFGLHVLQADKCGGGHTSLISVEHVVQLCNPETVRALCRPEFQFSVPDEFQEGLGKSMVAGNVLWHDHHWRIRYRSDTVQARTARASQALSELGAILQHPKSGKVQDHILTLTPDFLRSGSVMLVDNSRWLHSRSVVADPDRHLRRIRWSPFTL